MKLRKKYNFDKYKYLVIEVCQLVNIDIIILADMVFLIL